MDKKEILCLYDANKKYLNKQIYRHNVKEQKPGKEYHLVVNLFCVDKGTKKILLTKRDINKEYGNTWECTAGKCIEFENTLDAAIRELLEETGLTCNKDELNLINTFIFDKYIVDTYICSLKFNLNILTFFILVILAHLIIFLNLYILSICTISVICPFSLTHSSSVIFLLW